MADPHVDELVDFLSESARPDLKASAMQYVLGLTSPADGIRLLQSHANLIEALVARTRDSNERISEDAYKCLINITGTIDGVDNQDNCVVVVIQKKDFLSILLKEILDKSSKNADHASKVLSNLTRSPFGCRLAMDVLGEDDFPVDLAKLVEAFCVKAYNETGANLDYLGMVLSNLTQLPEARAFVLDKQRCVVQRLLPYTQYDGSVTRRKGAVGALKNCCFETDYHNWLLSDAVDILPHLLLPLAGPEELTEKDMEGMPEDLQYLEEDKKREQDVDIKRMLMESIMQLCGTKSGRKVVQDKRVYVIMREYHRWEKDLTLEKPILDLIDMLIMDEPEPGMENLHEVEVPENVAKVLDEEQG